MEIIKKSEGSTLTIVVDGRIDTATSPQLEAEIKDSIDGVENLVFDFEKVEYISSAGLRVLLQAQKTMNRQGSMVLQKVNETVMEVFEITGFSDILTIE